MKTRNVINDKILKMQNNFAILVCTAIYFILKRDNVLVGGTPSPPPSNFNCFKLSKHTFNAFFQILSFENRTRFFAALFLYGIYMVIFKI